MMYKHYLLNVDTHSAAEITLLEAEGRECVTPPSTTPTPEPTTTMPEPTPSTPPITPTPPKRLKSGTSSIYCITIISSREIFVL